MIGRECRSPRRRDAVPLLPVFAAGWAGPVRRPPGLLRRAFWSVPCYLPRFPGCRRRRGARASNSKGFPYGRFPRPLMILMRREKKRTSSSAAEGWGPREKINIPLPRLLPRFRGMQEPLLRQVVKRRERCSEGLNILLSSSPFSCSGSSCDICPARWRASWPLAWLLLPVRMMAQAPLRF